jgi:hypothetical protein
VDLEPLVTAHFVFVTFDHLERFLRLLHTVLPWLCQRGVLAPLDCVLHRNSKIYSKMFANLGQKSHWERIFAD